MTSMTERQQFAEQNEMSMEFVNWFFDEKKDGCGNAWFIMAAAMWEGWKGRANREAQPVALVDRRPAASGGICWQNGGKDLPHGTELFTAPPAPAMVGELLEAMEEVIRISDRDHVAWARAKAAITACRTTILQHVSQGYKLAPIEPTEKMVIHGFESNAMDALADAVNEANGWPYSCRESAECVKGIFGGSAGGTP